MRGPRSGVLVLAGLLGSALGLTSNSAHAEQGGPSVGEQPAVEEGGTVKKEVRAPELLSQAEVDYPAGADGDALVALKLLIGRDGQVKDVVVLSGDPPFSHDAELAARTWSFSPAMLGGEPRAAWILYQVEFVAPVIEEQKEVVPAPSLKGEDPGPGGAPSKPPVLEVTVTAIRRPGVARVMTDSETEIIPGAEGDPIRAIEAMPGTVPILASGPFLGLRGASPAMVGYEFDGISVPYLFHLARGPAVVHPWLVESAQIHGTGGPARLGRAGGGFIEAIAAEPEGRRRMGARIRLTDAAGGFETPFAEGKGSALAAGRYSYMRPLVSLIAPEFSLDFWDYQARIRYELTAQDTLEVLSFGAGDRSAIQPEGEAKDDLFRGSFHRAGIRYHRTAENGDKHRIGLVYGHDRWDARPELTRPKRHSLTARLDSTKSLTSRATLEYGGDFGVQHQEDFYDPDRENSSLDGDGSDGEERVRYFREDISSAAWVDLTWSASSKTTLAAGLRLDLYGSGASDVDARSVQFSPQPRFAVSHRLIDELRIRSSVGVASQPKSASQRPPGRISSVAGGLEHSVLSDAGVEWRLPAAFVLDIGVFQNAFFRVMDTGHLRVEDQLPNEERGQGRALGFELSLKRTLAKRLRGFVSYTYSRSERSLGRASGLARFDRPHALDVALAYAFSNGWSLSSRATYYSGYPAVVSEASRTSEPPRARDYYQVDWQVAKRWKLSEDGAWWGFTVGVLNSTLRSETNSFFCRSGEPCEEEQVGPATIPTVGIEGEL